MNARERKALLDQMETLARYGMGRHTYPQGEEQELHAAMEHWESKGKVHRAQEGDGWVLWMLGKKK